MRNASPHSFAPAFLRAPYTATSSAERSPEPRYQETSRSPLGHSTMPGAWLCLGCSGKTSSAACGGAAAASAANAMSCGVMASPEWFATLRRSVLEERFYEASLNGLLPRLDRHRDDDRHSRVVALDEIDPLDRVGPLRRHDEVAHLPAPQVERPLRFRHIDQSRHVGEVDAVQE